MEYATGDEAKSLVDKMRRSYSDVIVDIINKRKK
jgi:predicted CopG family antitoxin